jgi:hypothetical protein
MVFSSFHPCQIGHCTKVVVTKCSAYIHETLNTREWLSATAEPLLAREEWELEQNNKFITGIADIS